MAEPAQLRGGPVAALRRIAFLLERGREDTFKVKAFRSAAATILPLPPTRWPPAPRPAPCTDLPGIGASTGAGDRGGRARRACPDRLARLEAEHAGPLAPGATELRAALRGDLHSHSDWSDGGSPIEEMAFTAMELGHDYLVLTDHSPRLKVANGLSAERLARQLGVVDAVNEHLGGDASGCSRASRSTSSTTARSTRPTRCSRASTCASPACTPSWRWRRAAMTRRMVAAVAQPVHQRARPLHRPAGHGQPRDPAAVASSTRAAVFEACAEHDVAVEINSRPERRDPPTQLLELALDLGCLFSIDTDAHAPGQLDFLAYGCERAEAAGIEPDRIVNTWPRRPAPGWAGPTRR